MGEIKTKLDLLQYLEAAAKKYRKNAVKSVNRNCHMNDCEGKVNIPQSIVDALLVDFINFVGVEQGVDFGLYECNGGLECLN